MLLTTIVIMVTALVTIFSFGVMQSVMSMKDKPAAADAYVFTTANAVDSSVYGSYKSFKIGTVAGFKGFVATAKTFGFHDSTIELTADLDMQEYEMAPIGNKGTGLEYSSYTTFYGTFNGGNHTIKNLNVSITSTEFGDTEASIGLFGALAGTVENLIVDSLIVRNYDAELVTFHIGVIAGCLWGTGVINNCQIIDAEFHDYNEDDLINIADVYVGVVAGFCTGANNIIKNVFIKSFLYGTKMCLKFSHS